MSTFRKLLLATITSLVLAIPMTSAPQAQANPHPQHSHTYHVYYRYDCTQPWALYPRSVRHHAEAQRIANWLANTYSVETFIRRR